MPDDVNLNPQGPGEPKSPTRGPGEPQSPTVSRVPLRPLPGYAKDGAIDTFKLGSLPIGPQTGKNGPERTKFLCSKCRKRRWVIDSEAGTAAAMTRFTTCSFCDAHTYTDRQVLRKEQSLLDEIGKLRTYVEGKLNSFEVRMGELESRMSERGYREQPEVDTPVDLRADFETLRTQLFGEIRAMKSRVSEGSTPGREVALSQAAGASGSSPRGGDSPRVAESYIDTMYRRVVQSEPGVEVAPPATAEPGEVREGQRATRRRRRRRRKRAAAIENAISSQAVEQAPVNLLLGDSLVGRATEGCFTGLSPNNKCQAYPGAGVWRVTGVVGKLPPAPRNTLILSVGGNDFFGRRGRTGEAKPLLQDYNTLLEMARSKTSRCVVVGLVPRKFRSNADYAKARNVNKKIADLCRAKGMRFVDPWTDFFGKDQFFQRDGVHFTNEGSRAFVEMVRKNLYGPPRQRRRRRPDGSRTTVTGTTTSTPRQQPEARVAEAGPAPAPTVPRAVSADVTFASVLSVATPPPVVRSEALKRQRSPTQEVSARQSPRQKRRRASEGNTPGVGSSPVERSPPPPSGNVSRPE